MCHSWRLCVCIPEDRSRSGPKGSTNKPYLQQKARKGGVVGGGGKSTDVPFSFCLLLLSPFSSFNLVNTCCSYNMLRGQNPSPPPPRFHWLQPLAPPICLPIGPSSCCAFQPYCAPTPTPAPHISPHYASGQLRNNRRGQGSELLEFPYTNPLNHTHADTRKTRTGRYSLHTYIFFLFQFFLKLKQL